jgi:hypothetical protein
MIFFASLHQTTSYTAVYAEHGCSGATSKVQQCPECSNVVLEFSDKLTSSQPSGRLVNKYQHSSRRTCRVTQPLDAKLHTQARLHMHARLAGTHLRCSAHLCDRLPLMLCPALPFTEPQTTLLSRQPICWTLLMSSAAALCSSWLAGAWHWE